MKSREIYKYLNEGENETKKCIICGKTYTGWGNDAWPVADGYCCDQCNADKVIPARLAQMYGTKNESNLNEEDEWNTFTVNIGFGGYIGAEEEYNITARNKDEAVFHALDEAGSEAEQDLSVEEIEDVGDGEYEVEVGFAGLIGVSNNYTVRADNEEDAEMQALELAKEDLEVISVDGEEYTYESAKPIKGSDAGSSAFYVIGKNDFQKLLKINGGAFADGYLEISTQEANELANKQGLSINDGGIFSDK